MLKRFSRYFLSFCAGLVVASLLPVVATPVRGTVQDNQEAILAQNPGEASLNILAGCLDRSGYKYVGAETNVPPTNPIPQPTGGPSDSVPTSTDGRVDNPRASCANLRFERQIQQEIRCLDNGEVVQVQFNNGKPIKINWDGAEYVFVISYRDGNKGWVLDQFVDYNRLPRL